VEQESLRFGFDVVTRGSIADGRGWKSSNSGAG
jgi:hypothetical protein